MTQTFGFDKSADEAVRIWNYNAGKWPFVGSPWRPSDGDIAIYRKSLEARYIQSAAVFGATPEIRDFLAKLKLASKPTIVDSSADMLSSMSKLLKIASPINETCVKADWCEAPLPAELFDVVIGDMIWWVVSVEKQERLSATIKRILRPNGLFVSRFRIRDEGKVLDDPKRIITGYLDQFRLGRRDEQSLRDEMMSKVYDSTVDAANKRIDREKTRQILTEMIDESIDGKIRAFLETTRERLLGSNWTSQTKEEILGPLKQHFKLETEGHAEDYESGTYPIFAFRKIRI